jgi:mRNA-degrading endonuclease RelE of RelBE toxin-antitoxin system
MDFFEFSRNAEKDLDNLDPPVQKQILKKLFGFSTLERPITQAETLHGEPPLTHRFRVGKWRITGIWIQAEKRFLVSEIGSRGQIYKQKRFEKFCD